MTDDRRRFLSATAAIGIGTLGLSAGQIRGDDKLEAQPICSTALRPRRNGILKRLPLGELFRELHQRRGSSLLYGSVGSMRQAIDTSGRLPSSPTLARCSDNEHAYHALSVWHPCRPLH